MRIQSNKQPSRGPISLVYRGLQIKRAQFYEYQSDKIKLTNAYLLTAVANWKDSQTGCFYSSVICHIY